MPGADHREIDRLGGRAADGAVPQGVLRVRDVQGALQLGDLLRARGPAVLRAALPQTQRQPVRVVPQGHRGPVPRGRGPAEVPPGLLPLRRLRRRAARRLLRRQRPVVLRARRLAEDAGRCPRAAAADDGYGYGTAAAVVGVTTAGLEVRAEWRAGSASTGGYPKHSRATQGSTCRPVVEPPSSLRIAHGPEVDAWSSARARWPGTHAEDGEAHDEAGNDVT